ncbi:hypothetical protein PR048_016397 [Dryococelus australis]|uniref:Uncharacterized protein n=1 Tax=Dryococelus australis TaxID=614101 RepID=A0ABQ9HJT5_9NEOP|nr:hypothetical protein PR048_016397 [Dryococelus australis]
MFPTCIGGRGFVVAKQLAFRQGEPGSIPGGVAPRIFARGNRASGRCGCPAGFLRVLPFSPPLHSSAAPHSPRFTLKTPMVSRDRGGFLTIRVIGVHSVSDVAGCVRIMASPASKVTRLLRRTAFVVGVNWRFTALTRESVLHWSTSKLTQTGQRNSLIMANDIMSVAIEKLCFSNSRKYSAGSEGTSIHRCQKRQSGIVHLLDHALFCRTLKRTVVRSNFTELNSLMIDVPFAEGCVALHFSTPSEHESLLPADYGAQLNSLLPRPPVRFPTLWQFSGTQQQKRKSTESNIRHKYEAEVTRNSRKRSSETGITLQGESVCCKGSRRFPVADNIQFSAQPPVNSACLLPISKHFSSEQDEK